MKVNLDEMACYEIRVKSAPCQLQNFLAIAHNSVLLSPSPITKKRQPNQAVCVVYRVL